MISQHDKKTLTETQKLESKKPTNYSQINSPQELTNIVAHEEIIGIRSVATYAKKLDEIVKLSVNVAADGDRAFDGLHVPFLHKNSSCLLAQNLYLLFRQRLALHQVLDLTVQIGLRRHRLRFRSTPLDMIL